jgi:hypothetical protein
MFDPIAFEREFFEILLSIDTAILDRVAGEACAACGGRLHRGDYPRKPRGGALGAAAEVFTRRFSLCCGREGCRSRATPPSVRFLGRRVYVGAIVILAAAVLLAQTSAAAAHRATGIAPRTLRRWLRWWRDVFPDTRVFAELSARLIGPPSRPELPLSILVKISGCSADRVAALLAWLAPLTTASVPDGARFVRGIS